MKAISVYFNDEDEEILNEAMVASGGLSMSRFIRRVVLTSIKGGSGDEEVEVIQTTAVKKKPTKETADKGDEAHEGLDEYWRDIADSGIVLNINQVKRFNQEKPKGFILLGNTKWGYKVGFK